MRAACGTSLVINPPVLRVYPVPFNPKTAVRGTVKFEGLYMGTMVRVYTLGGRFVFEGEMTGGPVEWNGKNREGDPVVPGVYLWAVVHPTHGRQTGKLILRR